MSSRAHPAGGVLLGAAAGGLTLGASLLLRAALGVPSLSESLGNGLALLLPGGAFGALIDALQERGRPLLLLATSVLVVLVGAGLGRWLGGWSRRAVAPYPAAPARRRGHPLARWLAPAIGLWILTLPLIAVGEGSLTVPATPAALFEWLLLTGLVELLLGLPQQGGSHGGRLLQVPGTWSRRSFLGWAGGVVGAVSLGYLGVQLLSAGAPPLPRLRLGPPRAGPGGAPAGDLTSTADFYVVSKELFGPPSVDASSWRLEVGGLNPYAIGYQQLLAEPHLTQVQTLECISNPIGGTLISTGVWRGVPLSRLLGRAGVPSGTVQVRFECADGYSESLPLDQARAPTTLVVDQLNGAKLTAQHGFPARLLVVDHYGMKNPKWLMSIQPSARPYLGYWEQQGWNAGAYPKTFSRFDFPSGNSSLRAGRTYLLAGVAYAGTRGISRVELSVDGSRTWVRARLRAPTSAYTWTLWSHPWRPDPGLYTLRVRARDGHGTLQRPGSGQTYPSGASGYQQLTVLVR
ncbi:MAG: molybdopterin-dependent oxidoreductase [Candidatus Dormibacteria bacterium]